MNDCKYMKRVPLAILFLYLLVLVQSAVACDTISVSPHEQIIVVGETAIFTITGECHSHSTPPTWTLTYEVTAVPPATSGGIQVTLPNNGSEPSKEYTGEVTVKGLQTGTYKIKFTLETSFGEKLTKDVTVIVVDVLLWAPDKTINLGTAESPIYAAPVMLNDNHDSGLYYVSRDINAADYWDCNTNCPTTVVVPQGGVCDLKHRELEPVWDLDYVGGKVEKESDLLKLEVKVGKGDVARTVTLSITNNTTSKGDQVRLWSEESNGIKDGGKDKIIVSLPAYTVPANNEPDIKTIYVEGIYITEADGVNFKLDVVPANNPTSPKEAELTVYVVSLVERQAVGGTKLRRVINQASVQKDDNVVPQVARLERPIEFTVEGGSEFNGKFTWTVHNHRAGRSFHKANQIEVTYGEFDDSTPDAEKFDVHIAEAVANRRYKTEVNVSIDGKLTLTREIRVALNTYPGQRVVMPVTPNPGVNPFVLKPNDSLLQTHYKWNPSADPPTPIRFNDNLYPPMYSWVNQNDPTQSYYHLFFDPIFENFAFYSCDEQPGAAMRIFFVVIGRSVVDSWFSIYALDRVVAHETVHLKQIEDIRDKSASDWRKFDNFFSSGKHCPCSFSYSSLRNTQRSRIRFSI